MSAQTSYIQNAIKHWYIPLIAGVIFIFLGLWTFTDPQDAFLSLSALFTVGLIFIGLAEIIFALSNSKSFRGWGWFLFFGICSFLAGILIIRDPEMNSATLSLYLGILLLARSIGTIVLAIEERKDLNNDWSIYMAIGVVGLIFGLLLLLDPKFAAMNLVAWSGIFFLILGFLGVVVSLRLKKIKDYPEKVSDDVKNRIADLQSELRETQQQAIKDINS